MQGEQIKQGERSEPIQHQEDDFHYSFKKWGNRYVFHSFGTLTFDPRNYSRPISNEHADKLTYGFLKSLQNNFSCRLGALGLITRPSRQHWPHVHLLITSAPNYPDTLLTTITPRVLQGYWRHGLARFYPSTAWSDEHWPARYLSSERNLHGYMSGLTTMFTLGRGTLIKMQRDNPKAHQPPKGHC
jgi:hypothetical protein